ncbi:hypothetical protein [Priestia aryabhattai]
MYDNVVGLSVKVTDENIKGKITGVYEGSENTVFVIEVGQKEVEKTIDDIQVIRESIEEKINKLMAEKTFLEKFAAINTN